MTDGRAARLAVQVAFSIASDARNARTAVQVATGVLNYVELNDASWVVDSSSEFDGTTLDDYAIDGNAGTYWLPFPATRGVNWIEIDLGSIQAVGRILTDNRNSNNNGIAMWESSNDGIHWTQRGNSQYLTQNVTMTWDFPHVAARYWRNRMLDLQRQAFTDIRMYAVKDIELTVQPQTLEESDTAWSITSSGDYSPVYAKEDAFNGAVDRLDTESWHSDVATAGTWLKIDLGAEYTVSRFAYDTPDNQNIIGANIDTSTDDSIWNTRGSLSVDRDEYEMIEFAPVTARYIRIISTGANWFTVNEVHPAVDVIVAAAVSNGPATILQPTKQSRLILANGASVSLSKGA